MGLTTEDIAVMAAIIILSPDREGLKYPEKVEQIQIKLLQVNLPHYLSCDDDEVSCDNDEVSCDNDEVLN